VWMGCLLPFPRPDPSINPSVHQSRVNHARHGPFLPSLAGWLAWCCACMHSRFGKSNEHGLPHLSSRLQVITMTQVCAISYEENSFLGQCDRQTYVRHCLRCVLSPTTTILSSVSSRNKQLSLSLSLSLSLFRTFFDKENILILKVSITHGLCTNILSKSSQDI
jgi:hypothetical protein